MALLDSIASPADLKELTREQLAELAQEMRERMFTAVSRNGGHLASNLGVVELTLALHFCYDFGPYPQGPDRLLWDVGHQSYSHKLLTGRGHLFDNLRKKGSVSGFPSPDESPYDLFAVGHAGTAISTAVGMARGDAHMDRKNHVVAVVGDASIVNGLSFEGLNNAGTLKRQMLIILNDNGMSISKPQGAFAHYLERIRVSNTYDEAKKIAQQIVGKLPATVGNTIEQVWHFTKEAVKYTVWPGQIFETLGIKYMGPIDGHDLPQLIDTFGEIRDHDRPVLLHVQTVKGCGYELAANEPTKFHSPAAFNVKGDPMEVNGCRIEHKPSTGKAWTAAFAEAMIDLAKDDERIVGLTAAMPDGTGMSKFEKVYPDRYYDTGICESHLTAMAAGMAKSGLKPVAAIYSTFLQRAFDQVWQEVVLNHLPVVFALDRAGFVGDDGAVHHGFCDISFLRPMPGMVLMAPSDERELRRCLKCGLMLDTASALRYPRDVVPAIPFEERVSEDLKAAASADWVLGESRTLREGTDATIIAYGAMVELAMDAAYCLEEGEGLSIGVVDARFCKPIDGAMISRLLRGGAPVITVEDHSLQNGFGSAVLEYAQSRRLPTEAITRLGMPDRLIAHATRKEQLAEVGLDAPGIARSVRDAIRSAVHTATSTQPSRL